MAHLCDCDSLSCAFTAGVEGVVRVHIKEKHGYVGDVPDTILCDTDSGTVTSTVKATVESLSDTLRNGNGKEGGNDANTNNCIASGFMSFATLLKGDMSQKSVNFRTLTTPEGNGADVVVPLECIRVFSSKDGMDAILENDPWFIRNNLLILKKWDPNDRLSVIATKLVERYFVVAMPKLIGEGFYMCIILVEYESKPPKCSSFKVFGNVLNECPKKIVSDVAKNLNNPRQATIGVLVGPNVSFKSTKQIYRPVSNKNGVSTSGKKKQAEVSRQEVSNLNLFEAFNSIENDDDLGTNEEISKLAGKGNPLAHSGIVDSKSEVEVMFDKTANLMALRSFKGESENAYGNNHLLEQLRETNRDDDYDPYDDDLYESHDMYDHLQSICDDLDITIRGRKKK
ncbi:hypothetical protein Tco_0684484 [Tanacetum coccineum]